MSDGPKQERMRWARLRLTRAGWFFLAIAVLVGVAASKSEATLMLVTFGVMIGALYISAVLAWRMVRAVSVRRDLPERAWQNQTVHLAYHLRNVRRWGSCLGLHVEEVAPKGIESAAGYCVQLPPRAVFRAGARFAARKRGRIQLRAIQIATSFPFGLVSSRRGIDAEASLVIWPARGRLKHQLLHRGAVETSSAAPSGATGGQDEFFGLREYRPGDNPRWIHWRRSANKRIPVIREMARPLPETLWIILDTYVEDRYEGARRTREKLLRFTATLIDHAFSRGYRVGLALAFAGGPRALAPAEGRAQRSALLDALADVDVNTRVQLHRTVEILRRGQLREGQVIVVTPHADRVKTAVLNPVRAACRHLSVITEHELPEVFEDDPLAAAEEGDAA